MSRFRHGQSREMELACFPYSAPNRMTGAWVTGFEVNTFYENMRASPEIFKGDIAPHAGKPVVATDTELVMENLIPTDGKLRVFQMVFIGRRAKCPIGLDRKIVVERLLSRTLKGTLG